MSKPDFNLLISLDALLREQSVTGAAKRLGLSESAMSRTLSRLRTLMGDPLLVRAGRNMVLTPHAEDISERTRYMVFEIESILRPSQPNLDLLAMERTFTIRANDGFVDAFSALLITQANKEAPLVQLRFAPKPIKTVKDLREGLIDLDIGVLGNMVGPELRIQALFRDRFVGVVRKGHALEAVPEVTPELYSSFGHVATSRRGVVHGPVDDALAQLGLPRKVVAIVSNFSSALAIAKASDLIALVPSSFLHNRQEDKLWAFDLPVKTSEITISQMWHPRLHSDAGHQWLRELVFKVCRENIMVNSTNQI